MSRDDHFTLADFEAMLWKEPNCAHERACIAAIASIGGDPATVAELVAALRDASYYIFGEHHPDHPTCKQVEAVLAKLPKPPA